MKGLVLAAGWWSPRARVVAVAVGSQLGRIREMNDAALILAGLVSAVLPTAASALLGGTTEEAR